MAIITDKSPLTVTIPPIPPIHDGRYITPTPYGVSDSSTVQIYTSPDDADATYAMHLHHSLPLLDLYCPCLMRAFTTDWLWVVLCCAAVCWRTSTPLSRT
jgi:hypothetical protein